MILHGLGVVLFSISGAVAASVIVHSIHSALPTIRQAFRELNAWHD